MGASITLAGESLISQKQSKREALLISKFVLANVPGLDTTLPVDRAAGVPQADQIVHSVPVTREGYLATNKVVYSLMLGSDVGDFDFNWIGLVSAEDVLVIAAYVPRQQKRMEIPPLQAGNNLTRNIILEYDGAQSLTGINVPASSWQFDFTADFTAINAKIELLQVEIAKKVDLETWTPPAAVSLDGPVLVYPGSTNTYKITDYNRFSVFTASTTLGTVSVAADVVTLVVPTVAAAGLLTLDVLRDGNKASFKLPVGAASIVPPTITSPANLATGVALDLVLTATPFEVFPAGYDRQVSRRWQIATDEAFTQIVFDKTSSTDLISIRPSEYDYLLQPGKRVYVRAFDIGAALQSEASPVVMFNTATIYIRRPTIIYPTDGQQKVSGAVTILSDAFSVYGGADVHTFSRFQVAIANDGSGVIYDTNWTSTSLTSYKPPAAFETLSKFYARVKYRGQTLGETEWSPFVGFETAAELLGIYAKLSSGSTVRAGHTAVDINGKMYVFAGTDRTAALSDLWRYDPVSGGWAQLASGASARAAHSAVAIDGKMYVFGGANGTTVFNDLWKYDPATNAWTKLTSAITGRQAHSAVAIDGKMYVFGGSINSAAQSDLWRYDPVTGTWTALASGPARYNQSAVVINGKMYVFGGYGANYSGVSNETWKYDPATNAWTKLTSGASGRGAHKSVAIDGKMYVFGGSNSYYTLNDLWVYDSVLDSWKQLASGASVRYLPSAVALDGKMYVFGGYNSIESSAVCLNDLWSIS